MLQISKGWFRKFVRKNEEDKIASEASEIERKKRRKTLTKNEKKIFNDRELSRLALEFGYIYRLEFRYGQINIEKSIKQAKNNNGYDVDIYTILYLMKVIHKEYPTKKKVPLPNAKLILIWGLSLDKKYLKTHGIIWDNKNLDNITKLQQPDDYKKFLEDGDMRKLISRNSFHKYKERAINNGLKTKFISFLSTILSEIDNYEMAEQHPEGYIDSILSLYETGFKNIIEKLPISRKDKETNLAYIMHKNKNSLYSDVLDFALKKYPEELYEKLKLKF